MFHNEKIMNNAQLKPAWKAAHNLLEKKSVGEVSLPKVCDTLNAWVGSRHLTTRKRLSLRTSATLVNGTARLYKMGLDDLFNDVMKLDKEILNRNRRSPVNIPESSETTEDEESEEEESEEEESEEEESEEEKSEEEKLEEEGSEESTSEIRPSSADVTNEHIEQSTGRGESMAIVFSDGTSVGQSKKTTEVEADGFERDNSIENIRLDLETFELRHGERHSGQTRGERDQRSEIGTQTSLSGRQGPAQSAEFDENLPFSLTLIYNKRGARVPFKLIISSLNPDVRKL